MSVDIVQDIVNSKTSPLINGSLGASSFKSENLEALMSDPCSLHTVTHSFN